MVSKGSGVHTATMGTWGMVCAWVFIHPHHWEKAKSLAHSAVLQQTRLQAVQPLHSASAFPGKLSQSIALFSRFHLTIHIRC